MDEEEVFDLATISEYEVLSNEDGTALIQDNCVAIKHTETEAVKLLPLTDEVLQALGLAVVLDEDNASQGEGEAENYVLPDHVEEESQEEQKPETAAEHFTKFEVHDEATEIKDEGGVKGEVGVEYVYEDRPETAVEYVYEDASADGAAPAADDSQEEQYVVGQKNEDGTITIVFTDEEDAELSKASQEINQSDMDVDKSHDDSHNLSGHESESKEGQLVWNNKMVHRLLELYAEQQRHFYDPQTRHRRVWRLMCERMARSFPRMRTCSEKHLQSKFASLKRTYKGALDYYKDNLHLTNWKFFDEMHRLMQEGARLEEEARRSAPTVRNMPPAAPPPAARNDPWQKAWTVLLLDIYEETHGADQKCDTAAPQFWREVRDKLVAAEPDLARFSADQLQARVAQLKRKFRQRKTAFSLRDSMEKTIYERLASIHRLESTQNAPGASPKKAAAADTTIYANSDVTSKWSKAATTLLLDLYRQQRARLATTPAAAVYAGLARAVSRRAAVAVSADACMQRIADMRRKYRALQKAGPSVPWIYFKACKAAFGAHDQDWSPANTALLLQLYEEALRTRRVGSPGFWAGVALELRRLRPALDVSEIKCEEKMASLVQRYRALQQRPADEADQWPFYKQLQRIQRTDTAPVAWSAASTDALLEQYAARAGRLDAGADPAAVWREVAAAVGAPATPDSCRRKLQEMKEQFCQITREGGPAKNAPFYKRMNEIFAPHLWSAPNVRLLLDVVAPHCAAAGRSESQPQLWERLADTFNRCTHSSAVIGSQCQAQFRLLQARYRALLLEGEDKQAEWPFFQRMHELFGDYVPPPAARRDDRCFVDPPQVDDKIYYWSTKSVGALLDAYESHRHAFASQPRKAVWRRVDRALAAADPHYRAHKAGYGAWFKYLELLQRFMDIKEGRSDDKDWPFYERMNEIFTTKPSGRESGGSVHSDDDEDSGAESVCDNLEELLSDRSKRARGESETETSLNASGVAGNTRSKRKKLSVSVSEPAPSWEDEETHALIDVYMKHRDRLAGAAAGAGTAAAEVWVDIAADIRGLLGKCDKSGPQCEARLRQLRRSYGRMASLKDRADDEWLPETVFMKLQKLMKDEPPPPPGAPLANGDEDVLSQILSELRRRSTLLVRHETARARRHAAALSALGRVERALRDHAPAAAAQTDLFRDLEKSLAELHK